MNWLAENALPIWVAGAVAAHDGASSSSVQTRTSASLVALSAPPRSCRRCCSSTALSKRRGKRSKRTLYQVAATGGSERRATARWRSYRFGWRRTARLRKDIETLMPQVEDRARHNVLARRRSKLSRRWQDSATMKCRGFIVAHAQADGMKGGADDELTMTVGCAAATAGWWQFCGGEELGRSGESGDAECAERK